jgi:hypothetical protein
MKRSCGLLLLLALPLATAPVSEARAQSLGKTGTTAASFLKIGIGSRAIGMGGAFTATADDITSIYWNPGGLANVYTNQAVFSRVTWLGDVGLNYAAACVNLSGFGTVGVAVTHLGMEDMPVRTIEKPTGTGEQFTAGALSVGLTYARNLTDQFSIGITAKYVREFIWNSDAVGFATDIGTIYRIPVLNELRLAASISNFGTKMELSGRDQVEVIQVGGENGNLINTDVQLEQWDLPLLFRFGIAADVVKGETNRLTAAVDAVHPNDNTEYLNLGVEYAWNDIVFLRSGWKSLFERETQQGFTAGGGLHYRFPGSIVVMFDYAYQDWGILTAVHYLTFGVQF